MNQVMENWGNPRATKEQKFLILMNSSLPGFPFIFHSFSVLKNFDNSKMQTLFCTFSPRVHIVLGFTFRFMIHFRLIFIYGMGWELMFIFFPYDYPVDQTPFIKKIFLFLFSCFFTFVKSVDPKHMSLLLDSVFCSTDHLSTFMWIQTVLITVVL